MDGSEDEEPHTRSTRYAGPSNYNSEWDKFVLLIWKNIRILWSNWLYCVISVISPIVFCTILISLRISLQIGKQPIENYPIVDLSNYWNDLLNLISERRENMSRMIDGFKHNPFIPQLIVGYAPNNQGYTNIMMGTGKYLPRIIYKSFETCDELREAILEESLFAGACFNQLQSKQNSYIHKATDDNADQIIGGLYPNYLKYRLIFPYACRVYHDTFIGISWHTHSLYHFINRTNQRNVGLGDGGYVGYIREGFAPLQNAISMSYLQLIADIIKPNFHIPAIYMCRYPSKEFLKDEVIESIDFSLSLMLIFGNFYPILMFVSVSLM